MLLPKCRIPWEGAWIRSGLARSTPLGDARPGLETPFRPPQRRWSEHQANALNARKRDFQAEFCKLPFQPSSIPLQSNPISPARFVTSIRLNQTTSSHESFSQRNPGLDLPTPSPSPIEICTSDGILVQLTLPSIAEYPHRYRRRTCRKPFRRIS